MAGAATEPCFTRQLLRVLVVLVVVGASNAQAKPRAPTTSAQLQKAARALAEGNTAAAEAVVQGILKKSPDHPLAINLLGVIRAETGNATEAESLFRRAIRLDPRLGTAYANLGVLRRKRGDIEGAFEMLAKAIELSPRDGRSLYQLGLICGERGDYAGGIRYLLAVPPAERPDDYWTKLAGFYITTANLEEGERCLKAELKRHPGSTDTLRQLAGISLKRSDTPGAMAYIVQALRIAPNSPELVFDFAQLSRRAGLVTQAIVTMRRLLMLEPDKPEYIQFMGASLLDSLEDYHKALPYFERYVAMRPHDPMAHLSLSWALVVEKEYDRARKEIAEALRLDPNQNEAYYQLGMIASENGQITEAIEQLSRVVEAQPDHRAAQRALGAAFMRNGQFEQARQALEAAERLDPQNPGVHYQLSQVFARLGDTAAAQRQRELYQETQKKAPKARDAQMPQASPQQ